MLKISLLTEFEHSCKCGAQFCYRCGAEWKKCACPSWDEDRLLARTQEVVDRQAHRPLLPPERQHRVDNMREELRQTHECTHPDGFERMEGVASISFLCDMFNKEHWLYIHACRRCHLIVCGNCLRNRVR